MRMKRNRKVSYEEEVFAMNTKKFKVELIAGVVEDIVRVPYIDEDGGEAFQNVDIRVRWEYPTKVCTPNPRHSVYLESEIRYLTYSRVNGKWTLLTEQNFRKQMGAATEKVLKRAEEMAKTSMRERNLREGRLPEPTVIPDFLDRARSI